MSDNKPVVGYVTIGPAHAVDPNAPAIDVPSIMRASGFNEGFAAGVEAAARIVDVRLEEVYGTVDHNLRHDLGPLAQHIRELVKK